MKLKSYILALVCLLIYTSTFAAVVAIPRGDGTTVTKGDQWDAVDANFGDLAGKVIVSGAAIGTDIVFTLEDASTVTVDASTLFDNTDAQTITALSLNPTTHVLTVTISGGNTATVDLSGLIGAGSTPETTAYGPTWEDNAAAASKGSLFTKLEAMSLAAGAAISGTPASPEIATFSDATHITGITYAALATAMGMPVAGTDFYTKTAADTAFQGKNDYLTDIAGLTPVANNLLGWNDAGTALENKSTLTLQFGASVEFEGATADAYEATVSVVDPVVDVAWTLPYSNYAATTDPGVTNDLGEGYSAGSIWVNTSTPAIFQAVSVANGAADWNQLDASGGAETNSLETIATGIATTEIPIGTAADTVVYAPLSGDVAMSNAGVVTIGSEKIDEGMMAAGSVALDSNTITGVLPDANIATTLTRTIASGTSVMGTTSIADGACATVETETATGTATTDVIDWGFNGTPAAVTGYNPSGDLVYIIAYPTANNVNFLVCNKSGSAITPGAVTLNWKVTR